MTPWSPVPIETIKAKTRYALVGGPFGSELTRRDYVEVGVPVIRGVNLPEDRSFRDDGFVFVRDEKADQLVANTAYPGDVVFTQRGTLGQVGLIPTNARFPRYIVSQSQMKLTVNLTKADPRFVFFWFRHPSTVQTIKNHALTSGVPHINLGILRDLKIPLPRIEIQQAIADVLGDFENCIENNRRRMMLLEDAASVLYREWFVRLRFPGYEHTRVADGLPETWKRRPLAEACVQGNGIQTGPFGSQLHQADYTEDGVPVVMPKDIINLRIATTSIARIPEPLAIQLGRHRMQEGDVVYGRRGEIGRRAYVSRRQIGWLCGTGSLRLRPDPQLVVPRYFFDALGAKETAGTIASRAKGATMPNLNASIMASVPVLVPREGLQRLYAENVEPIFEMIETLAEQNQILRVARDLLLPRLMSGEIAV